MRSKNADRSPPRNNLETSGSKDGSSKRKFDSESSKFGKNSPSKKTDVPAAKVSEESKVPIKRRKLKKECFDASDIIPEDMSDVIIASQSSAPSMTYFINLLSPQQRANVEEIGFGGLLKMNLAKDLNRSMYEYLVLNYNPTAKILIVGDNKISFNSVDLHNVLGIPHTSTPVIELCRLKSDSNPDKHIIQEWRYYFGLDNVVDETNHETKNIKQVKKKFNFASETAALKTEKIVEKAPSKSSTSKKNMSDVEKKDKTVTKKKYVALDVWKEKFIELKDGGDEFKKIFVLFAISNFLSPYGDKSLNLSVVKSLSDVNKIKDFNWCGFIIKNMCNSIKELHKYLLDKKKRPTTVSKGQNPTKCVKKIGGCLPAMLVNFVQKVHFGEYAGVKLPFISNWNSDTLNARIKAQTKDRSQFGFGIVKQDIVLSSDALYEHSKALEVIEKDVPLALEYKNELRISSEDESTLYVQYKIPNDLPTDREIQSMDVPDVEKNLMTLYRNMKITSSVNLSLIKELKQDAEILSQEASQPESDFEMNDEFLEMLDSITDNLIQLKKLVDKKEGFTVMVEKVKQI